MCCFSWRAGDVRYSSIAIDQSLPLLEGNFGYVYGVKWRNEPMIKWLEKTIDELMQSLGIHRD
ncbi:hypothetical protein [Enterovibrio paralichthyis]|uniref:hypothetical protein n=1 Tax=Enterovibrio paralichthyis TaxID=2853805 RepID=UPI001C48A1B8|nr:hypothetical protein [Enterovibrio paralichthyis]MBV7296608.1 hypothetical protein [Enterovibrio paralichthyis]